MPCSGPTARLSSQYSSRSSVRVLNTSNSFFLRRIVLCSVFEKFRSQVLIRGDEGKYKNGLVLDADGRYLVGTRMAAVGTLRASSKIQLAFSVLLCETDS